MATITGDYSSSHHHHHLQQQHHSHQHHNTQTGLKQTEEEVDEAELEQQQQQQPPSSQQSLAMQTATTGTSKQSPIGGDHFSNTTTTLPPDNNNNTTESSNGEDLNGIAAAASTSQSTDNNSSPATLELDGSAGNGGARFSYGHNNNNNNNTTNNGSATSSPAPSPTPSSSTSTSANGGNGSGEPAVNQRQYRKTLEYLKQLFSDRERLQLLPLGVFAHVGRLLEGEIQRVRASLIHIDGGADQRRSLVLPEPEGEPVQRSTKVYVPAEKYPELNFIGRIIGPRGLTIRELEADCGCKLYIRGHGSLRDKSKEEKLKGQENFAHLNEDLHVLITVEDAENRAALKLERAVGEINKLLESVISNKDEFKMRQLAELAILNDKFKMQGP
ncbi:PREDICTED: protein held out wings-like, partial [Rhagoletis zephyria]|uniref:protein held out wings-like n=1 Tax=Rhagoletis zephyria TaxID=28612 RepID=UPI00081161D4